MTVLGPFCQTGLFVRSYLCVSRQSATLPVYDLLERRAFFCCFATISIDHSMPSTRSLAYLLLILIRLHSFAITARFNVSCEATRLSIAFASIFPRYCGSTLQLALKYPRYYLTHTVSPSTSNSLPHASGLRSFR